MLKSPFRFLNFEMIYILRLYVQQARRGC